MNWLTALAALAIAPCSPPRGGEAAGPASSATAPARHEAAPFGQDDTPVQLFTLTNKDGLNTRISNSRQEQVILRPGQLCRYVMIHTFSAER